MEAPADGKCPWHHAIAGVVTGVSWVETGLVLAADEH